MKNELLSVTEAAERLGVSRNTINNYYKAGKLPYQIINNRAYFTLSDVEALRPGTKRVTDYRDSAIDEATI